VITTKEYFGKLTKDKSKLLTEVKTAIKKAVPKAEEITQYGVPAFKLGKNKVAYAIFTNHIGIYPTPKVIKHFKEELKDYKQSKGAIQFPIEKPLPIALIKKITKHALNQ
jgi:uncharacterized protein YdhG (YjbR/CyaY superfamily)